MTLSKLYALYLPVLNRSIARNSQSLVLRLIHWSIAIAMYMSVTHYGFAQITSATPEQLPAPTDFGHQLLGTLQETVNPADGSLTLNLPVPVARGRGPYVPFSFNYSSNQVNHLVPIGETYTCPGGSSSVNPCDSQTASVTLENYAWASNPGLLSQDGWSYGLPSISAILKAEYSNPQNQGEEACYWYENYTATDAAGRTHALNLSSVVSSNRTPCANPPTSKTSGGDDYVAATVTSPSTTQSLPPEVLMSDHDGNVYTFGGIAQSFSTTANHVQTFSGLPTQIEDRNGNLLTVNNAAATDESKQGQFTITDASGRTSISSDGFGISGTHVSSSVFSNPFTVEWESFTQDYSVPSAPLVSNGCGAAPEKTIDRTTTGISTITLPNGTYYTITYQSQFGLVNKVSFPDGGYVRYVWIAGPQSLVTAYTDNSSSSNAQGAVCAFTYAPPVIQNRFVSYDGIHEVEEQDFAYSTTFNTSQTEPEWSSKTTTVATKDLVSGQSYITSYTYTPAFPSNLNAPNDLFIDNAYTAEVPVESTIVVTGSGGLVLRTTSQQWADPYEMSSRNLTNGAGDTAGTVYHWNWADVLSEVDEYNYGDVGASTPDRATVYAYSCCGVTPVYPGQGTIVDRPSSEKVYAQGTLAAETDYAYDSSPITPVSGLISGTHDEVNYSSSANSPRGNLTSMLDGGGGTTSFTYDETGQAITRQDQAGNTTQYSYQDNYSSGTPSGNTNAYLTQIIRPLANVPVKEHYAYRLNDGQVTSSTDPNGNVTSYKYVDPLSRLTETDYPDGGEVSFAYNDSTVSATSPSITTTTVLNSSQSKTSVAIRDGMGHTVRDEITSDEYGNDFIDSTYNGEGQVAVRSNPYRSTSDPSYGNTLYSYDALGRTIQVTDQDGSTKKWCYDGQKNSAVATCPAQASTRPGIEATTDYYDENGHHWQDSYNAFGNLTAVVEPDPTSGASAYETDYQYDALNDMVHVDQLGGGYSGDRYRDYRYDGLQRLTVSTDPESGQIFYQYNTSNGGFCSGDPSSVCSRTDARGIVTTYSYDALNRLTQKSYSDGTLPVNYQYDQSSGSVHPGGDYGFGKQTITNGIGRLTYEYVGTSAPGVAAKFFDYDAMGRQTRAWQCWDYLCTNTPNLAESWRIYDQAGDIVQVNDGNGNDTYITYDGAERVNTAYTKDESSSSGVPSVNLITATTYSAVGPQTVTLGDGQTETYGYDKRLRVSSYSRTNAANSAVTDYGYSLGYDGVSNVTSATESFAGSSGTWQYQYDGLNRLLTAVNPGFGFGCAYTYDAWGNRLTESPSGTSGETCFSQTLSYNPNKPSNPNTNGPGQLNSADQYCFDASGDLLDDGACPTSGGHKYTYDAEGRMATANYGAETFIYDADGRRVGVYNGSTYANVMYEDVTGEPMSQWTNNQQNGTRDLWVGGRHAGYIFNNVMTWTAGDWLGSERVRTSSSGSLVASFLSLPYGNGQTTISGSDNDVIHYTGKQRDTNADDIGGVNGMDYFGARLYSSATGRFMSPDPSGAAFSDPSNPQSWNMYSYVQNNPLNAVDPDGLDCVYINNDTGAYEGFNSGDCDNSTTASANSGYYFDGTVNTLYTTTGDRSGQVVGIQGTSDETGGDLYDANPAGLSFAQPNSSVSTSGMNTTIDTFGNFSETVQFNHGTHPFRDNNPGDIVSGGFVNHHGAIGADGRFGVFPSAGGGKAALDALLHSPSYRNLSVNAAVARYAPAFENNTVGYQQFLLNVVGVSGGTPISSLSAGQLSALENGIARYEGASASGNYSVSVTSNF